MGDHHSKSWNVCIGRGKGGNLPRLPLGPEWGVSVSTNLELSKGWSNQPKIEGCF